MEWKLREKGLDHFVDSAGTSDYHTGEEPDHRAVQVCIERGVDISMYRARPFTPADFSRFDRIYVMDGSNLRDVLNLSGDNRQKHKVSLILNTLHPGSNRKVPDPYFGGDEGFVRVFDLLDKACEKIAEDLSIEK